MDTAKRLLKNNSYYDRFVAEVGARSETRDFTKALELFLGAVNPLKTIIDVGCGSGIHLLEFKKRGFKAVGVEPSLKMRELCKSRGLESVKGAFEDLKDLNLQEVGGIWCAASLLHVPREHLATTFKAIGDLLPLTAPFYFTVRLGEGVKWDRYDDKNSEVARFIQLFSEKELMSELAILPFKNVESWVEESTWGRPSKWISVVAYKDE